MADCPACYGDGWIADHEDECYESGDCNCSGVQVECSECGGTGDWPDAGPVSTEEER